MLYQSKNKKAMGLYVEFILYMVVFFIISIIIFFVNASINTSIDNQQQSAPELNYQFRSVFVKSFLYFKVSDDYKKEFNLNKDEEYMVYQLLQKGDKYEELIEKMREDFIKDNINEETFSKFEEFSGEILNTNDLLYIEYLVDKKPDIDYVIEQNNYVYFVKTLNNKYSAVYFNN